MRRTSARTVRSIAVGLTALGALAGTAFTAVPASAAPWAEIARGVTYKEYDIKGVAGVTRAHVLNIDLNVRDVRLGLLHPGKVAARETVSKMTTALSAVAGVNGDFFNISESQHPGIPVTGASVGPAIADGAFLKGAVPDGQRFGPPLPPGTTTEDVVGVGTDDRARMDRLALAASAVTPAGRLPLSGLNQYALAQNSIGVYTPRWGSVSRARAVCGTDTDRAARCTTDTYEVTVHKGRVSAVQARPGSGAIAAGSVVLVGREAGARHLRGLVKGERVEVSYALESGAGVKYRFAVGGYPVLSEGKPLAGLDARTSAVRTAVGIAGAGRHVYLLALDGAPAYRKGLTVRELADALKKLGAVDGFSLDGGGSSTLVTRPSGTAAVVRNHPSDGAERPVANGVGVFVN